MKIETSYQTTETGLIAVERQTDKITLLKDKRRRKAQDYFCIRTKTTLTASNGQTRIIKLKRKIALGLMDYFLENKEFQAEILRQNEVHARRS